jgi:DNA-binding transcriptional MerR regulator
MSEHTISELSALSGLSVRTIRYYVAQGLIPSAGSGGPATRYPDATLARLRLITRLRDAHQPLAEIRKQLLALSDDQVLALAGTPAEPEPAGTALDYVRSVLGGSRPDATLRPHASLLRAAADPGPPRAASATSPTRATVLSADALPNPQGDALIPAEDAASFGQRSQWERVAISPDIELHVRRPLSRRDNRLVERLLAFARQLQEQQP